MKAELVGYLAASLITVRFFPPSGQDPEQWRHPLHSPGDVHLVHLRRRTLGQSDHGVASRRGSSTQDCLEKTDTLTMWKTDLVEMVDQESTMFR